MAVIGTSGRIADSFAYQTSTALTIAGQNTGNLAFQYGFPRLISGDFQYFTFDFKPEEIAGKFDAVCLPAANFLYSGFDLGDLARRLDACGLPLVVIGLGAQAFKSTDEVKLQAGTERLLRLFAERCVSIAVRGPHTAAVLERYGVHNFAVLGCPSNFINLDPNLGSKIAKLSALPINSMSYCPTFYSYNASFEREILDAYSQQIHHLICQDPPSAVALARGSRNELHQNWLSTKSGFLSELSEEQRHLRKSQLRTFFDAPAWMEFYLGQDAVIGSRIHGVNLGWQAGRPAALISYDLRTEELASTMGIAYVKVKQLTGFVDMARLQDIIIEAASNYDDRRTVLAHQYVEFLQANLTKPSAALMEFTGTKAATYPETNTAASSETTGESAASLPSSRAWGFLEQYNRTTVGGWIASNTVTPPDLALKINGQLTAYNLTLTKRSNMDGHAWNFRFDIDRHHFEQNVARFEIVTPTGNYQVGNSPVVCSVAEGDDKKVLVGQNGYLYLQNDSNDVLKQISGERLLGPHELDRWKDFLLTLDRLAADQGGVVIHLIAPNKECVYSDFLPPQIRVSSVRPLSQLQDLFNSLPLNNSRFIYPLEILKTAPRPDAYPKGDSHWSDYGVHLVVQHIFEVLLSAGLLAEMPRYSDLHFTSAYRNADLLSKLGGSCIELQPVLHHAFRLRKTLDNGVINTGRRREFSAFAPISDKTLQLWHDSFGEWLIPYFGEVFSKTSCAWSPTVDESFVQTHSPQIMIVERAERFLIQPGTVINHTGSTL